MNTQIVEFNFNSNQVRTDSDNGQIWFCLRDLCNVLELPNITWVTKRLNQKGVRKTKLPTKGGLQEMIFVNEPNMYRTVTNSNKPQAVQFENWIYEEVLPSIRKTGNYSVNKPVVVSEYTRSLPSGKKEIVLSNKAKEEIGGITKAVVVKTLDEKLQQYFRSSDKLPDKVISEAFHQTADEIQAKKAKELKEYRLTDSEAEIIEKIRSANAFNMLNLFMGVSKKLSA